MWGHGPEDRLGAGAVGPTQRGRPPLSNRPGCRCLLASRWGTRRRSAGGGVGWGQGQIRKAKSLNSRAGPRPYLRVLAALPMWRAFPSPPPPVYLSVSTCVSVNVPWSADQAGIPKHRKEAEVLKCRGSGSQAIFFFFLSPPQSHWFLTKVTQWLQKDLKCFLETGHYL